MNDFREIRNAYTKARRQERMVLADYLKSHGFSVTTGGASGQGRTNYTAGGTLSVPYDLSNWIWLDASLDDVNFFISFQPFDSDPNSGNFHVLYDRIGVYMYTGKYCAEDARKLMRITPIDLPLDAEKLEKMEQILRDAAGK